MQVPTEKPPWDPNDKESSLEQYASWLNAIACGAFLQDGHHSEMFFFVTETGELLGCQFRDGLPREKTNAVIHQQASEIKPFGTIQIIITKIYHPKLTSHPKSKGLRFVGASSPDSDELERDCLIVRMLSKAGKDKIWANPILQYGDHPVLGNTFETYAAND